MTNKNQWRIEYSNGDTKSGPLFWLHYEDEINNPEDRRRIAIEMIHLFCDAIELGKENHFLTNPNMQKGEEWEEIRSKILEEGRKPMIGEAEKLIFEKQLYESRLRYVNDSLELLNKNKTKQL